MLTTPLCLILAPASVTRTFSTVWSKLTGQAIVEEPYYHATFAALTKDTLSPEVPSLPTRQRYSLRKATSADVEGISELCYQFALTSEPFTLERAKAMGEARMLIKNDQAYVCDVEGTIACLVAVTRSSIKCAAITKVVTHPAFLRQGWAKKLVREVSTRYVCLPTVKFHTAVADFPRHSGSCTTSKNPASFCTSRKATNRPKTSITASASPVLWAHPPTLRRTRNGSKSGSKTPIWGIGSSRTLPTFSSGRTFI